MSEAGPQEAQTTGAKVEFTQGVKVPPCVLVRHLDGESVLLNLETERYFGLDAMGTRMWEEVTASPNIAVAYGKLLAEFEVDPELLRNHLTELLSRLLDNGLLKVSPSDVGTVSTV
jgi:Coenzyme PQQ synthesis protein D (PqqD)